MLTYSGGKDDNGTEVQVPLATYKGGIMIRR